MGLYNDEIGSIVQYALDTLRTSEEMDRILQLSRSRCLREIVYPRNNTTSGQENNMGGSKIIMRRIGENTVSRMIFAITAETSQYLPMENNSTPDYLNNKPDLGGGLRISEYNWYTAGNIPTNQKNAGQFNDAEIQLLGEIQSLIKPGRWAEVAIWIGEKEPPLKNRQLCKI